MGYNCETFYGPMNDSTLEFCWWTFPRAPSGSCLLTPCRLASQVTRLQYLNALMASRVGQSPDPPEIKILPNSQTKLLNDRNTTQGSLVFAAVRLPGPRCSAPHK